MKVKVTLCVLIFDTKKYVCKTCFVWLNHKAKLAVIEIRIFNANYTQFCKH